MTGAVFLSNQIEFFKTEHMKNKNQLGSFAAKCHEDQNQFHKDYQMIFGSELPFLHPLRKVDPIEVLEILGFETDQFDLSDLTISDLREHMITNVLFTEGMTNKDRLVLIGASFMIEEYIKWLSWIALPVRQIVKIEVVFPDAMEFSIQNNEDEPVFRIDGTRWDLAQILTMLNLDINRFLNLSLETFNEQKKVYAKMGYYSRYEWILDVLIFCKRHCDL